MKNSNQLYPIFLKLNDISLTIIGGGKTAEEKVHFILKSSPNANIKIYSKSFTKTLQTLNRQGKIRILYNNYNSELLKNGTIIIGATNNPRTNRQIYFDAKKLGKLVNIVDTPDLCDFYLGSIVNKGSLKIALSSNGLSPTYIKKLKEVLEESIDLEENNKLISNLNKLRYRLGSNFNEKVKALNSLTKILEAEVDYINN